MIRCVRIWTGDDRNSHFEEGVIDLEPGQRGDVLSGRMATTTISFEETAPGGAFAWHTAPIRQLVITLSGTLDFQTREGEHFLIRPGDSERAGAPCLCFRNPAFRRARDMVAFPSAASGCVATTPPSTSAIMRRFMEKPRTDRRPCRCRTSILG